MNLLGYPIQEIALATLVAGFCWAFGGMAGVAFWQFITSPFRKKS